MGTGFAWGLKRIVLVLHWVFAHFAEATCSSKFHVHEGLLCHDRPALWRGYVRMLIYEAFSEPIKSRFIDRG